MGGANYMGGKRNAMKTRARDEVGRKQKGFFGRQRFDMLSKGLSAPLERSAARSIPFGVRQGPEKIALAHARGKHNEEISDKEEITTCYIPSPVRVPSNKGSWRTRTQGFDAHTSSSDATRSEVLDNLDLSEPTFFRETIERILATPDLAGLGTRSSESSNAEPEPSIRESSREIPIKQKRQRHHNSEQESYKVQHLDNVRRRATFEIQQFRTPQIKEKKTADDNFGRYPRGSSPTMSPMEDISDWDSDDKFDESFHDSGYIEHDDPERDTDSWIVNLPSTRREQTKRRKSSRSSSVSLGSSACVRPDSRRGGIEDQDLDDIPTTIELCARRDGGTVYGKLFNDPDPWRRIGIILGLEDADNAGYTLADDGESSFDDGEQHQSMFWEAETGLDEEMDLDDQGCLQEMSPPKLSQLHEEDMPDISSQGFHQEKTTNKPEQPMPSDGPWRTQSPSFVGQTDNFEIEENDGQDSGKLQHADQGAPQDRNSDFERSSPPVAMAKDETDEIMHSNHNLHVLAVPQLQEVDGRFIAPAIFDDDLGLWEES